MARESKDVWARRVARWAKSGLSREAFAAREGVKPATLGWWRWFLGAKVPQPRTALAKREATFVEVQAVIVEPRSAERIEVALANGRVVRVPEGFDDATLHRVLAVAERR